jgi:hypothetical protein
MAIKLIEHALRAIFPGRSPNFLRLSSSQLVVMDDMGCYRVRLAPQAYIEYRFGRALSHGFS